MTHGWLDEADRALLLEHARGDRDRLLVRLYTETVLELDEIAALRSDSLFTETVGETTNHWVSPEPGSEKAGRDAWVPPDLWRAIDEYRTSRLEDPAAYLFSDGEPAAVHALEGRLAGVLDRTREATDSDAFESVSVVDLKLAYYDALVREKYQYDQ